MIDTSLAILTASNGCHYFTVINSEPFMCALCRSFHLTLKIDLVRRWKKNSSVQPDCDIAFKNKTLEKNPKFTADYCLYNQTIGQMLPFQHE